VVSVVRRLIEASPRRSISIDAVANALKSRGFQRPAGSPRLVTRLRRIRELLVSPAGVITLAEDGGAPKDEPPIESGPVAEIDDDRQPEVLGGPVGEFETPEVDGNRAEPPGRGRRRRRRRRRGGQRRPTSGPLIA
jgi:hypothetical protein